MRLTASKAVVGGLVAAVCALSVVLHVTKRTSDTPNIVLIVIDTLRPDPMSCYGYGVDTTPFRSDPASQGTTFNSAYSASSWTAPGTASIHTSLYPSQHGVVTGLMAVKKGQKTDPKIKLNSIPGKATTTAEVQKRAGYSMFAITDNLNITRRQGFDQGFDGSQSYNYETAETVNRTLAEWRDEIGGAPCAITWRNSRLSVTASRRLTRSSL